MMLILLLRILGAGRVYRLLHQILQTIGLLKIIGILGIDNLEQNLLYIGLVGLILHYLTKLDSVDLC